MDLYKWAHKLVPAVSSELVMDCFELARDIRSLDMRAAPYDLRELGYDPLRIETPEGKAQYAAEQRAFSARGQALRERLAVACDRILLGSRTEPGDPPGRPSPGQPSCHARVGSGHLALPDGVRQVRHAPGRLRADRLEGNAVGVHALEQADPGAEQHGRERDGELVDEPGVHVLQDRRTAACDPDVPVAGGLAGPLERGLDPAGDEVEGGPAR